MATDRQGSLFELEPAVPKAKPGKPGKGSFAPGAAAAGQGGALPGAQGAKVLTLVDASGFIFRAYHALPPLTTSKGVPTHAVLGFTRMLLKLLRERQPSHIALCFDKDSRLGRLAIDPQYKANREAPPADLLQQFSLIREVAGVLNLPILEVPGWEADDVIATLAKRARAQGYQVLVITSDKDFLQLLDGQLEIYDPMKDRQLTEAYALERYGVRATQMRDYLALVGDAIDNVPKVPGIGPKTAQGLLAKFGDVGSLLARLDEVDKPKIREALKANAEQLQRALKLVTMRDDLEVPVEFETLARQDIRQTEARAMFTGLEFYRLLNEMPQGPTVPLTRDAVIVEGEAGLGVVLEALAQTRSASLVPAFTGRAHSAVPLGLALAVEGKCFYVLAGKFPLQALGAALLRADLEVIAHDGKTLLHVLAALGLPEPTLHTDVELLSYLLNPSRKEHALPDLARERLRVELPVLEEASVELAPVESVAAVLGAAADAVLRLAPNLWVEAEGVGMASLYRALELPFVPVLASVERRGVQLDLPTLAEISKQVEVQVETLLKNVYAHAGRSFNVGSPQQLAQVLYEELKLPILKKNKTGPSTDHEVLEKLAEQHPLPNAIIEYRNVSKLKSTYLDTLPGLLSPDGRIRTTFHQAAVATGRLSSSDPNLQNIPVRTELGRQVRRAFIAGPGRVLVSADYSQIELRVLAHVSRDEGLVKAFAEEADVHRRTAALVFGVEPEAVTADQRRAAKMVNYGIAYGLSPHGLSTRLNIPTDEARSIITAYFARFPGIQGYIDGTIESAKRLGYVESLLGRRRYLPDLVSRNRSVAMAAERAAINMPIQGTAADLIKKAMLELERRIPAEGLVGRMVLQVHDELLFEVPEGEAAAVAALAREVMGQGAALSVPLVIDVGQGHSWADAH